VAKKTKVVFIEGSKVLLRPLEKKDINMKYLSWINDAEVTRCTEIGNFPTTLMGLRTFYSGVSKSKNDVMLAIVDKKKDLHIGNIKLGGISWIHRFADLGIIIGEKKYWGRGYGSEACRLLLKYAFECLNLNKVTLGVYGTHEAAIEAYKKAGFKTEGRLTGMMRLKNKYVDKVIMGISQKEYLSGRSGKDGQRCFRAA